MSCRWKKPLWFLAIAVILTCVAPTATFAQTFRQSAGVDFPSLVAVGQTGLPASVSTANDSVLGGTAGTSITIRVNQLTLQVSCTTIPLGVCSAAGGENPPVFSINEAVVAGQDACTGATFNVAPTGNPGEYTFTPQDPNDPDLQLEIGEDCLLPFTVDVDNLPATDADGIAANGIQTVQTLAAQGTVVLIDGVDTEAGVGTQTAGSGQNITTVAACEVTLDKQVSCDGGTTWFDVGNPGDNLPCTTQDGQPVLARFIVSNTGDLDVECTLDDDNPFWSVAGEVVNIALGGDPVTVSRESVCSQEFEAEEPNTATLNCQCPVGEDTVVLEPITDLADIECVSCDVEITKTVACEQTPAGGVFTDFGDFCTAFSHDDVIQDVIVRYEITNTGEVNLLCVPTDANPGHGLTDTNPGLIVGSQSLGTVVPGPLAPIDVQRDCTDELAANEPDTATVTCFCCLTPDCQTLGSTVSAQDDSDFACATGDLSVVKRCDEQVEGTNHVVVDVCNTGDAGALLENCTATDAYFPEDPLCPGDVGASTPLDLAGDPFSLAPGACLSDTGSELTGDITGLTSDACNEVSVTCEIADSGGKTLTRTAEDECEAEQPGCLTRTPGFWGTHPAITALFLPLDNCGVSMTTTLDSTQGSATEDMCSVGTDAKTNEVFPQQVQLERQCMAANLNVAATSEIFQLSCDASFPGTAELIDECCNADTSVCRSSLTPGEVDADNDRTINDCIADLDAFNNADDAEPDVEGTVFESPGPADPGECQDSKNNGFLNDRPRAANVKVTGQKKK